MKFIEKVVFAGLLLATACTNKPEPVAVGLDGRAFYEPKRSEDEQAKLEEKWLVAKRNFEGDASEENYIWYGRRTAYLFRYPEAIEIYTKGLKKYPSSYRLYRHRAHRYITMREFDKSIDDSKMAIKLIEGKPIESEPDGQPNVLNIPKSTYQSNIFYHLGLAYYLKRDYENAAAAYEACMKYSDNDDLLVAVTDWLFITYHRLGRKEEAAQLLDRIMPQMSIIENEAYHKRLLMYKGLLQPDLLMALEENGVEPPVALATQGYGLGNWYLIQGDTTKAITMFKKVISGESFSAFGFIAAEVDLQVLQ